MLVMIVKAQERDDHPDNHLRNLQNGNKHGRLARFDMNGHQKVVEVHEMVDGVIHHDKENPRRRLGHVAVPTVKQDGNMVVPVQENQGFLVNDNEQGIQQLSGVCKSWIIF